MAVLSGHDVLYLVHVSTNRRFRLGADTGPDQLAAVVDHLEATGVDSLWFSELVYSKAVDPFVGMGFALARTTNLKVGTSVAVLPGRHPVLVAKQLASLAGLAPKRVLPVFGLRSAIPADVIARYTAEGVDWSFNENKDASPRPSGPCAAAEAPPGPAPR